MLSAKQALISMMTKKLSGIELGWLFETRGKIPLETFIYESWDKMFSPVHDDTKDVRLLVF